MPAKEPPVTPVRWTRHQCDELVRCEILEGRYELIDGEIISKMGQKPPHSMSIMRLNKWLVGLFGGDYVRIQLTMNVRTEDGLFNEPEPDAVALSLPGDAFMERHPGPGEVLLIVEVSDTSLKFDLRTKGPLYARAGFQEYWVLDIVSRRLIAHRNPQGGLYKDILEYTESEIAAPLARPDAGVRVADLLPPISVPRRVQPRYDAQQ